MSLQAAIYYRQYNRMNKILEEHIVRLEILLKEVSFHTVPPSLLSFSILTDGKTLVESRKSYPIDGDRCLPFQKLVCELGVDYDARKSSYFPKQVTLAMHYEGVLGRESSKLVKFDPFLKGSQREWLLPQGNSDFQIEFVSSFTLTSKKAKVSQMNSILDGLVGQRRVTTMEGECQREGNKTRKLEVLKSVPLDPKKKNTKRLASPKYAEESDETAKPKDELESLRRKIEQEREEKVRSISKLKMEISPNFLLQLDRGQQSEDIIKLKEKLRNLERKEKSLQASLDELSLELQKRKNKIAELEGKQQELEKGASEKDVRLKTAQSTIRTLTEQLEGFASKQRTCSKKGQAKEAAFRDQLRKLQEKLRLSHLEIAKANEEKNSTIKSLEFCEKIHQNALKEKDMKLAEQKARTSKLREEFAQREKELTTSLDVLSARADSLQQEKGQAEERVLILTETLSGLEGQLSGLREALRAERNEGQRRLEENSDKAYGDINSARLKYNDLASENNLLKDKTKRLELQRNDLEARIKELEEALKTKSAGFTKLSSKTHSLRQQIDEANEELQRRARQIEALKQNNISLKAKLTEAKEKFEEERARKEEANAALERQIGEFCRQAQSYECQIKDLKWAIVRSNDSVTELEYQLREQNSVVLKLNQEAMARTHRITTIQEALRQVERVNQQLQGEKIALGGRVKELAETGRLRQLELEEERKERSKAIQQIEYERQKNLQITTFAKEREAQEEERWREREVVLARRQEQIEALELEITKRREEIVALKSSLESVQREVQISKLDNDNIKSEFSLLDSAHKALKLDHANLQKAYETTSASLVTSEENLAKNVRKWQQLGKEFQEYREGTERALQNLLSQLFKEETSSANIIAATLFPFPSQRMSTLQIELVQRRNSFIIRWRQRLSELEQQVELMERQAAQGTTLQKTRAEIVMKQEAEERDKLKNLLYESMLEKNALAEEVAAERKEIQEVRKEVERLKVELYRREETEQELNGQLHLLLLQLDAAKAETQDFSALLFKHKEMEIRNAAESQQRLYTLQEEANAQIEKLKAEGLERERKIIQLEKDLLELSDKSRRLEEEKFKLSSGLEISREAVRLLEDKDASSAAETTRLHNTIKNLENRESTYRDSLERLDKELGQQRNKIEVLQASLNDATSDNFEGGIQRERLTAEINNLRERCGELERALQERGEVSRERLDKKMEQNAMLKSTLIQKTSQLELRDFHIKQKEQLVTSLQQENEDLKKSNTSLKQRVKEQLSALEAAESKGRELLRDLEQLGQQRVRREQALSQSNFYIMSLQNELEEMGQLALAVQAKEKECIHLREAKNEAEQYYTAELKKAKESNNALRKQLKTHKFHLETIEEEYKTNLDALSKSSNQRCRSLQADFLLEKDDFAKRVEEIEVHNKRVVAEYQSRIQRLREELVEAKESERGLLEEAQRKEIAWRALAKRKEQLEGELEECKHNYNRYYHLYLDSRAETGKSIKESCNKLLNTVQKSKLAQVKQYSFKLSQLQRKVERLHHSQQMDLNSESLSRKDVKAMLDKIFGRMGQYIKEAQIEAEELWEASRIDSQIS